MKKIVLFIFLACSVAFGAENLGVNQEQIHTFKSKQNDGVAIKIHELQGVKKWIAEFKDYFVFRAIDFEISHNGKSLLKGRANVHPNSYLGGESDTAENGVGYDAVEFWNEGYDKGKCALSIRIQDESIDESDKEWRLTISGDLSKCESLKGIALENKIFYKINKE